MDFNRVLENFENFSKVPHGSGHMDEICDYCIAFAQRLHLEWHRDAGNNIVIKKPATIGREKAPTVILQGHLDMVCDKTPDASSDPERDGVKIIKNGDILSADNTTLGADDGIAVAYALTILESTDIEHPALEVLLTTDEEIGMIGASKLDTSSLSGKTMLNIDSAEEGCFTVACAGGVRADFRFDASFAHHGTKTYKLTVSGLLGGHSGEEIDRGRSNAYKLLGETLYRLNRTFPVYLASIGGGGKDNAIAKYAEAIFSLDEGHDAEIASIISESERAAHRIYGESDPDIHIHVQSAAELPLCIDRDRTTEILEVFQQMPNGVISYSHEFPGFVETSLNLGVVTTSDKGIELTISLRSFKDSELDKLLAKLVNICEKYHGRYSTHGKYPAWPYVAHSHLRDIMVECYRKRFGEEAKVMPIHAGLECGLLTYMMPGLDCISFGPNIYDLHTPRERMSISSAERTWHLLLDTLKTI